MLREICIKWLEAFFINVLKCGPVPRHVAFIMDGNRRYAEKVGINRSEGHRLGSMKIDEVIHWCLGLEINEVTFYGFSLDNFKRSKEEVKFIMDLIGERLLQFFNENEDLIKDSICIRVLGDLTLLPVFLQQTVARCVLSTQNNTRFYWNICLSYSSREEMANATREIAEGINKGLLIPSDITEELYKACFYAQDYKAVDLLIRTSGEVRLSDFLLWQSSDSLLYFVKVHWPEFGRRHFLASLLQYQYCKRVMKGKSHVQPRLRYPKGYNIEESGPKDLYSLIRNTDSDVDSCASHGEPDLHSTEAEERKKAFLSYLRLKGLKQLENMSAGLTEQKKPYYVDVPSHKN